MDKVLFEIHMATLHVAICEGQTCGFSIGMVEVVSTLTLTNQRKGDCGCYFLMVELLVRLHLQDNN